MTMMQRSLCNVVTKLNKENFAGRYSLIESERGEELKQQPVVSNFCCWINIERHSLKNCVIEPTTKTCVEAKPKLNVRGRVNCRFDTHTLTKLCVQLCAKNTHHISTNIFPIFQLCLQSFTVFAKYLNSLPKING